MANCIRHQMSDGTIMEGPVHGPGQVCIEYESNNGRNNMAYRRRGTARKATPTRGTARRRPATPTRGTARRRPATPTRGTARRRRGAAVHTPEHTNSCGPGMTMNGAGQCVQSSGGYRRGSNRINSSTRNTKRGASRVSTLRGARGASQQYNPIHEANFINGAGVSYYCPPGKTYGSGFCVKKSPLDGQFTR
jgi:hypothetical protein